MSQNRTEILVAGGGVAALEALLALQALAADRVELTLLAPEPDFVYRPLQTAEPFSAGHVSRRPLAEIAEELGATLVADGLAEVFPSTRQVHCSSGTVMTYDLLVVAVGTVAEPVAHAATFAGDGARELMGGILADLEGGWTHRVAFVAPQAHWTLPLYELALMTAREVWAQGIDDAQLTVVSPEERPLDVFGEEASATVAEMLAAERIAFVGSAHPQVEKGAVVDAAGGRRVEADRIVSLPRLRGPALEGLPCDEAGYLQVDPHGRVEGVANVYAAGDATSFPVKQGGLATQQADAVAADIAHRLGAAVSAEPFRPVLRGLLLTGGSSRYLVRGGIGDDADRGHSGERPLWWPPTKIAGRYLAPYLHEAGERDLLDRARYAPHVEVEAPLGPQPGSR
jgi:sulfide:quinone oxidoreductase